MTLDEYRIECGWSQAQMARKANIDPNTLRSALSGNSVSSNTANRLAKALSRELGQTIRVAQIEGLNVNL